MIFPFSDNIPVVYNYLNEISNKNKYYSLQDYKIIIESLNKNNFNYYGKTLNYLLDTINHFPVVDKNGSSLFQVGRSLEPLTTSG